MRDAGIFLDRSNIMFRTAKGQESAKESIKQVYVSKNILGQCNGRRIVDLELVADYNVKCQNELEFCHVRRNSFFHKS